MEIDGQRLPDEAYRREVVAALMQAYGETITRYCMAWLGEGPGAEVAQEVFVTAWERLPKYKPEGSILGWLRGIAHNKCQQAFRNRRRQGEIVHHFMQAIREEAHAETPATPELGTMHKALAAQLQASLSQLQEVDRLLLLWYYWQDRPIREIAAMVGKRETAVRKRLERAIQRLREMMGNDTRP